MPRALHKSIFMRAVTIVLPAVVSHDPLAKLNAALQGYPRNHNYRVVGNELVPSEQLRERADVIGHLWPSTMERFLEIGSCKGYFVLQAASLPACRLAVGIDVHPPFIDASTAVAEHLQRSNAQFHLASLEEFAQSPEQHGGPFQVVQLVSTYHYLYWGSHLDSSGYRDHGRIMEMLARVTGQYLIFANPVEVRNSPRHIRQLAQRDRNHDYNREAILKAARPYFDVFDVGSLDRKNKRPMMLFVRRDREEPPSA